MAGERGDGGGWVFDTFDSTDADALEDTTDTLRGRLLPSPSTVARLQVAPFIDGERVKACGLLLPGTLRPEEVEGRTVGIGEVRFAAREMVAVAVGVARALTGERGRSDTEDSFCRAFDVCAMLLTFARMTTGVDGALHSSPLGRGASVRTKSWTLAGQLLLFAVAKETR